MSVPISRLDEAHAALAACNEERRRLEERCVQLDADRARAEIRAEAAEEERDGLRIALAEAEQARDDLQAQHEVDERQFEYFDDKLSSVRAENEQGRQVNQTLRERVGELERQNRMQLDSIDDLGIDLAHLGEEIEELRGDLAGAHKALNEREQAARELRCLLIENEWWAQAGDALHRTIA